MTSIIKKMSNYKYRYFVSTINYECRHDIYFEKSYEVVLSEIYDKFLRLKNKIIHLDGIFGKHGYIEVEYNDGSDEWTIDEITKEESEEIENDEGYLDDYNRITDCVGNSNE